MDCFAVSKEGKVLLFLLACLLAFLVASGRTVTLSSLGKSHGKGDLVGVLNQVAVHSEYCRIWELKKSA